MGGRAIDALPTHRRARLGLGYVSQEREIFSSLTVMENLAVAALPRGWPPDRVFALFPLLAERRRTTGNRLSGGEQQMLAIARALVGGPKILLLDEPAAGVPSHETEVIHQALGRLPADIAILIIEHDMGVVFRFAHEIVVLAQGRVLARGSPAAISADPRVRAVYLGKSAV